MVNVDIGRVKYFNVLSDIQAARVDSIRLVHLNCKHIIQSTPETKIIEEEDVRVCQKLGIVSTLKWGSHRNGTVESEKKIIDEMVKCDFKRPMRVVWLPDDSIWCDNTHTAISWIYRLGRECTLSDVPYYIVDLRTETPNIVDIKGSLSDSIRDCRLAIACSLRIRDKMDEGWRPRGVYWMVEDLIDNLEEGEEL